MIRPCRSDSNNVSFSVKRERLKVRNFLFDYIRKIDTINLHIKTSFN